MQHVPFSLVFRMIITLGVIILVVSVISLCFYLKRKRDRQRIIRDFELAEEKETSEETHA